MLIADVDVELWAFGVTETTTNAPYRWLTDVRLVKNRVLSHPRDGDDRVYTRTHADFAHFKGIHADGSDQKVSFGGPEFHLQSWVLLVDDLSRSVAMLGGWLWLRMCSVVLANNDRVDRSAMEISQNLAWLVVFRLMRSETCRARVLRLCAGQGSRWRGCRILLTRTSF
jgi:hypothetical protein